MSEEQTALEKLQIECAFLRQEVQALKETVASHSGERAIVFIDNTNLNFTTRKIDCTGSYRLCYNKLVNTLAAGRMLQQVRIYYSDYDRYANLSPEESHRRQEREKFYSFLKYQGFFLKACSLVERGDGTTKEKGLDAAIVRDMQRCCEQGRTDTIILVAGDQDYKDMISDAQSLYNMRAEVAFFQDYTAPGLQYVSSKFINLTEIKETLRRDRQQSCAA